MDDDVEARGLKAHAALERINRAWLEGRPREMRRELHPDVAMVYPGFAGRSRGADALIAGFEDFCENAAVQSYRESDHQLDTVGGSSIVTFRFEMVYERAGNAYRCSGRDLWVFDVNANEARAVWRTMLELEETPVQLEAGRTSSE